MTATVPATIGSDPLESESRASPAPRLAIIGGGASGTLLAAHVLRNRSSPLEVVIVETRPAIGPGLAYSTSARYHLLNLRAGNMSAFPDDPGHFLRWLGARHNPAETIVPTPFCFVPRYVYGDYLRGLLDEDACARGRLSTLRGRVVDLTRRSDGYLLRLADGSTLAADAVVIATGNETPRYPARRDPWDGRLVEAVPDVGTVLLVGSGLTMIDTVLALAERAPTLRFIAVSRRGLLPQAHRLVVPIAIEAREVPFGAPLSRITAWLRGRVAAAAAAGQDWRSVVDGLSGSPPRRLRRSRCPPAR